jgi:hypothetical protein
MSLAQEISLGIRIFRVLVIAMLAVSSNSVVRMIIPEILPLEMREMVSIFIIITD